MEGKKEVHIEWEEKGSNVIISYGEWNWTWKCDKFDNKLFSMVNKAHTTTTIEILCLLSTKYKYNVEI